jgi:hypothetical protein
MTKTIRYAFNSQEGYESAKKALDSHQVSYSAGSDNGTLDVQVDDDDHINEIIGRQMAKDGVNGRFTSSLFDYDFYVPRDFGPNEELFANLEALKQVLKGNPNNCLDDFWDFLYSLPERQADDLLKTICGAEIRFTYVERAEDFQYISECVSKESVYPDATYEEMKEFVKQCFAKRYLEQVTETVKSSTDCSVAMDFPYVGDPADALDVIIKNRKRNI